MIEAGLSSPADNKNGMIDYSTQVSLKVIKP